MSAKTWVAKIQRKRDRLEAETRKEMEPLYPLCPVHHTDGRYLPVSTAARCNCRLSAGKGEGR